MAEAQATPEDQSEVEYPRRRAPGGGATDMATTRRDEFDRDVWAILGAPVDIETIDTAIAHIDRAVAGSDQLSFVTPNVNWLVRACRDGAAMQQIRDADLSLADGAPLVRMARLLGAPIGSRVAGSDLFEAMRRRPPFAGKKISVFFFGGRDGSAEAAAAALDDEPSALVSAGWLNPGFGDLDEMSAPAIIDAINEADPDFIVVALGAAKGQAWIERNRARLNASAIAHLGAVVDFTAGTIRRAPKTYQRLGLEWLWRIKEEPALWRRYAADAVSLGRLGAFRLAPLLAAMRGQKSAGPGRVETRMDADASRIRLVGDFTHANLSDVRAAFRAAAAAGRPVILDAEALGTVDMAFVGLLLLLRKQTQKMGMTLAADKLNTGHRRILAINGLRLDEGWSARAQDDDGAELVSAAG